MNLKTNMKTVMSVIIVSSLLTACGEAQMGGQGLDLESNDNVGFLGELEPQQDLAVFSKNRCVFYLTGSNGYQWITERYVGVNEDCSNATNIVRTNNPRATITKVTMNFVYDPIQIPAKTKCTYYLEGAQSKRWISERYIFSDLDCQANELSIVRANNPNARVYKVTSNHVYDAVPYASKTKCTFTLRGQNGARWISERYIVASDCTNENSVVRQKNPNATILSVDSNFVHDPY
jgi:hypothetical protein